ncbi:hypothetical protein [Salisediminibacterium selenitireducens]|uniref:GerMN domain-containing protein n=1 Tax=Bacillus selenitireducens (strain ATCC 700615 / DSM 15326 / MLS10) TaxID=439292 RepID=D6XXX9_BACIE|nr:hypothetical protein [Salisediminibacterium selenitireducens]ADH98052.1 hypothetical protein Bsel_0516 [[Bacillus] selenitireducens MLS10]
MTKRWSDEDIEKTLTKMPAVEDSRSKNDLMEAIEAKSGGQLQMRSSKKKKRAFVVPSIATAAAILLIAILLPSLFNQGLPISSDENAATDDMAVTSDDGDEEMTDNAGNTAEDTPLNEPESEDAGVATDNGDDGEAAIMESLPSAYPVFSVEVITRESDFVVGVSPYIQDSEEVLGDAVLSTFHTNDPTSNGAFAALESVTVDEGEAALMFSEESLVSLTSSEHQIIESFFDEIFTLYGISTYRFETPEGPGIQFGQVGEVIEADVTEENRGYYLAEEEGQTLLLSARAAGADMTGGNGELLDLETLISRMTDEEIEDDFFHPVTDTGLTILSVSMSADEVTLTYEAGPEVTPEDRELFYQAFRYAVNTYGIDELTLIDDESGETIVFTFEGGTMLVEDK